jgi:hypothetical protein
MKSLSKYIELYYPLVDTVAAVDIGKEDPLYKIRKMSTHMLAS